MALTKVTYSMIDNAPINVKDYGAVGDGLTDDTAAIQAAVTFASNNSKAVYFPSGAYEISAPITFGGTSFAIFGEAAADTIIREVSGSGQIRLFDMSGLSGDSCIIEDISFYGPTGGGLGGTGIHIATGSGIDVRNCWFAGLLIGVYKAPDTADVVILNCTFEACFDALALNGAAETICDNNIFYICSYDYNLAGDFIASNFSNSNHLGTGNACVYLNGVRFAQFTNISCAQEFQTNLPVIIDMVNTCSFNNFINVQTKNFGSTLVKMAAGAACTNNTFDNIVAAKVTPPPAPVVPPPAGTLASAVVIGSGNDDNIFTNFNFYGCDTSVILSANNNRFSTGIINVSLTSGVKLQNADGNEFTNVKFINNAIDWEIAGTVQTVWVNNCETTLAGLTPIRIGSKGAGVYGRLFYGVAAPAAPANTLPYFLGDRVLNINPVVGQPKAWVCTVAGSPGTWVSDGNL